MEHKGTKYMETERLILRRFIIEDADAIYKNWTSDKEYVMQVIMHYWQMNAKFQ